MRADVERNTASGTDAWNNPVAPSFTALGTYPCWVWSKSGREIVDGEKTAAVEDLRIMLPLGTDVREDDEIARITDRKGTELIPGRLKIDAPPQRKHRHIEAPLQRVA